MLELGPKWLEPNKFDLTFTNVKTQKCIINNTEVRINSRKLLLFLHELIKLETLRQYLHTEGSTLINMIDKMKTTYTTKEYININNVPRQS